jgi:hypothetical protein
MADKTTDAGETRQEVERAKKEVSVNKLYEKVSAIASRLQTNHLPKSLEQAFDFVSTLHDAHAREYAQTHVEVIYHQLASL